MTASDEIAVYRLTELRVLKSRGKDMVVLAIRSGAGTTHYGMTVKELGQLAERLRLDALMLASQAPGSA